jgi:hypothetical protein
VFSGQMGAVSAGPAESRPQNVAAYRASGGTTARYAAACSRSARPA